ncbi:hypothetical protein Tcan_15023 [Toxocara canis]|uniref:Uncharacterized protein n=1 Tax=Toxocara canis TaxID=6265 RepID=A0A0B2UM23_TOXCA|nr:hypothetical protein Tcan_15023 [Toxocara canis]
MAIAVELPSPGGRMGKDWPTASSWKVNAQPVGQKCIQMTQWLINLTNDEATRTQNNEANFRLFPAMAIAVELPSPGGRMGKDGGEGRDDNRSVGYQWISAYKTMPMVLKAVAKVMEGYISSKVVAEMSVSAADKVPLMKQD